jgi:hypothetical protein
MATAEAQPYVDPRRLGEPPPMAQQIAALKQPSAVRPAPLPIAKQPRPAAPTPIPTPEQMAGDQGFVQSLSKAGPKDIGTLRAEEYALTNQAAKEQGLAKTEEAASLAKAEKSRSELMQEQAEQQKQAIEQHKRDLQEASPFAPTPETAKDIAGLFSLISVAAFGSGGKGRYSGMQTLASLTGAMKGYQAGRKDVFEQDIKNFEENLKVLKSHNDKVNALYEDAMKLMSTNKELGLQKIQQLIAEDNTGIAARLARSGQYQALGELLNKTTTALQKTQETKNKLSNDLSKLKFESDLRIKEKQAEKALKFGPNVGGAIANIYRATGFELPKEDAFKVIQAGQGLRAVDSLQQKLADKDVQTGLRAIPSTFFEKVKSLTDPAEINQAIDELDANQKTVLALKDSLLVALTIEQARSGTRVPVFTQKTVGPILALTNYQPQTYNALLNERKDELYGIGGDNGLSRDAMSKVARISASETAAPTAPAAPAATNKPVPTEADRARGRSNPTSRTNFINHFGVEP